MIILQKYAIILLGGGNNIDKQVIWTFVGLNVNGERPKNLNVGVIMFVKKIFDDPSKPEVQDKIIKFKENVEAAKICGYSIRDPCLVMH